MAGAGRRIPTPAVPVVDRNTGLMTTEWYDFLNNALAGERLGDFATDAAAAAGGVPMFGLYRTGSVVKVRTT
jgi:hypothetical protein